MKLKHYSRRENFGDSINPWLWRKLIPDFDELMPGTNFYGIGSILFWDEFFNSRTEGGKHLVFGSGFCREPVEDLTFDVDYRFVRGPLSADRCGLDEGKAIADAAYAALLLPEYEELRKLPKKYEVTIVPHLSSERRVLWSWFERFSGIRVARPWDSKGAEFILREICQSKFVVAEAMHGAIFADVFRIPWVKLGKISQLGDSKEFNEFKWRDWLRGVKLDPGDCPEIKFQSHAPPPQKTSKFMNFYHAVKNTVLLRKLLQERMESGFVGTLSEDDTISMIRAQLEAALADLRNRQT